jgi:hypothetical protein
LLSSSLLLYGSIFLGNPDNVRHNGYLISTDGPNAGGTVDYDPRYECTGGSNRCRIC